MSKRHVVLCLILLAATTCARANTIVSGSVSNRDLNGNTCNSSATANVMALSCGSTTDFTVGLATLTASVGDTSGSMNAVVNSFENPMHPGFTTLGGTNFSLLVNGTYILTGGTGLGTANLSVYEQAHGAGGGGTFTCSLKLGALTQNCSATGVSILYSFLVPYNMPLALNFNLNFSGSGAYADGVASSATYNFGPLTPAPTPEPISLLLLATGLIPLAARRRHV